jgi:hypothetical protein
MRSDEVDGDDDDDDDGDECDQKVIANLYWVFSENKVPFSIS